MSDFSIPAQPGLASDGREGDARLWRGYAALCAFCWLLYAMAGTEWDRGSWHFWDGIYEATLNLGPPIVLGAVALPWVRWLQRRPGGSVATTALHLLGALVFVAAWQLTDFVVAWALFGADHATATFQQRVLWRAMWGVFAYAALVFGFGSALHARRAQRVAIAAARAEAALVRAELANISGKLNPHFLFNTLNSLLILTRKDAAAAEQALFRFSRMMRYVLDTTRSATDRVPLNDELEHRHLVHPGAERFARERFVFGDEGPVARGHGSLIVRGGPLARRQPMGMRISTRKPRPGADRTSSSAEPSKSSSKRRRNALNPTPPDFAAADGGQ